MKKAIITGVSSGLGGEISKVFLEKGYDVVGLSRTKPTSNVLYVPTDFTDEKSISRSVEEIKEKHADFSQIICCAGIGYIEKLDSINYEHTEEIFKVNITGQNYLLSQLIGLIRNNNADIVFLGATIGYKGNEFMPMYSVTKWGLRGLIENRRNELKNSSCRVIGVHPGGMDTESNIGPDGRETIIGKMTGKSVGTLLDKTAISHFIYNLIELPKNMEISEVIINRK